MTISGKVVLVGLGLTASALLSALPASAQYYGRGYDRSDRYEYDRGQYYQRNVEAQKRAIRAQREAQRRAMRGGSYGAGAYAPGARSNAWNNGPTGGGFVVRQGPYGSYAAPATPTDNGRN